MLDATGVKDYSYVVKGYVVVLVYSLGHLGCKVFNLGVGSVSRVINLVKTIGIINGIRIPYKIVDRCVGAFTTCYANQIKSKRLPRRKAEKKIEDMCRDSWRWQQSQKE